MKLMHIADLHLDSPFTGIGKQLQALQKQLIDAPFRALERAVSIAINQQADVVVIAGDIYDSEQQTIQAQYFFAQQLERLHQAEIPVVLCHGNHDYIQLDRHTVQYPDNVHVFRHQEVEAIDLVLKDHTTVRFYGFSYTKRWIDERMIEAYPVNPKATDFTVGVLHGQMDGAHYAPFDVASLVAKNYDYWALGHIHQAQVLNETPLIQYSGTIQGRQRNEVGDKGAYLVELVPQTPAKNKFISLAPIVWQSAELDCRSDWHELDLLRAAQQVVQNYQEEAIASQQSQLLTMQLTHFEFLDATVQAQVESGDFIATLNQNIGPQPFVAVVKVQALRQVAIEPFQYDSSLNDSFTKAVDALSQGELYNEVMQPVFQHGVMRTWLSELSTHETLRQEISAAAEQLVVQAVGFDVEEVSHED